MLRQLHTLLVSFFVLTFCSLGFAQSAQIQGQVSDTSGAVISKASVRVEDQQTGAERITETNENGLYVVSGLSPSQYKIFVQAAGFSSAISNPLTVNVAQNAVVDFKLQVGQASSQVVVDAGDLSVNTTDATVSTVVDRQFVENMPLNGRSFQSLITLTPGVQTTPTGNGDDQGQFSVAGQRSGSNSFSIDGVSANFASAVGIASAYYANGGLPAFSALGSTSSLVSVDALQEFRLASSSYAPEYGRWSGGQVVLVTRSGTNHFHGSVFDYFRNDALDANDWFANNAAQAKPRDHQNDFGGVLGGPIVKDKTFFFFSYEGLRVDQPKVGVSDVPSVAARAEAAPSVKAIVQGFPLPNGPETAPDQAQYTASYSDKSTLNATSVRLDQVINSRFTLFGRYDDSPSQLASRDGQAGNSIATTVENVDSTTLGFTALINAKTTNDLRFNYSRARGKLGWTLDNFDGAIKPPDSALLATWQNPGTARVAPETADGRNTFYESGQGANNLNRQININDTVELSKGTHLMKFGFDYRRMSPALTQASSFGIYEWLTMASLVEGQTPFVTEIIIDPINLTHQLYHNFSSYGQDTWKVSPRLTLTYGLRWDYNPPPSMPIAEAPYTLSQITDLSTATLLPKGTPMWHADWKNFAPRLGGTYLLIPDKNRPTVLRAGVGQFYDLGTSNAAELDNGEGFFPYSLATLCVGGVGPICNSSSTAPYNGPEPPFVYQQPYDGIMAAFDPHLKLPYAIEWSVALEQTLSASESFKITYVGSIGRRLLRFNETNSPNQNLPGLWITENASYSNYNGLQAQFQRRLSRGLQALVSYSWAHSQDVNSADFAFNNGGNIFSGLYDIHRDYGNSDFDIRNSFSAALNYNIPSVHFSNAVPSAVLRNWSLNSITIARSGTPFNALYIPAVPGSYENGGGGALSLRPNQVPGQSVWIKHSAVPGGRELNLAAFNVPAVLTQGTEGRNSIAGFSVLEMDLALRRRFSITEGINLQFRADAFNFLNHPNFGNPLNTIGTCAQGVPCTPTPGWGQSQAMLNQSLGAGNAYGTAFGSLYQIGGPRSLQLSAKVQF